MTTQKPYIETDCTITHEGHSFTAGGAIVTPKRLVAYPAANGRLNDWHGNQIGTWKLLSERKTVGHRSWVADTYCCMRATVNGRNYSLRGFGIGMIATGRALKVGK